jgi:hypothetical protein
MAGIDRKDYQRPMGNAAVKILKEHFAEFNADRNEHHSAWMVGARPSDLYMKFADATNYAPSDTGIVASVNHPAVRQRLKGGTIRPVNVTCLTLAANAFAYGKRASQVGVSLKFMFAFDELTQHWRPALVAPDAVTKDTGKARKDGTRRQRVIRPSGIYYWLVKSVTQGPNPGVLPDREKLLNGVADELKGWAEKILGKN